jgi:hypothetical protein
MLCATARCTCKIEVSCKGMGAALWILHVGVQIVVQGIPWAHTDDDLAALFQEVGTVEQASVVYSKDGRSRVRISALYASLCFA